MIKDSLNIIKVGGATVENEESLQSLLMSSPKTLRDPLVMGDAP